MLVTRSLLPTSQDKKIEPFMAPSHLKQAVPRWDWIRFPKLTPFGTSNASPIYRLHYISISQNGSKRCSLRKDFLWSCGFTARSLWNSSWHINQQKHPPPTPTSLFFIAFFKKKKKTCIFWNLFDFGGHFSSKMDLDPANMKLSLAKFPGHPENVPHLGRLSPNGH